MREIKLVLNHIMVKITKEAALAYHENGRPGKIEVIPTKSHSTQTDLSLATRLE